MKTDNCRKVGIGIVGLNNMGYQHLKNVLASRDGVVTAVCDINKELADKVSKEYSITGYYDYIDLLKDPCVEAVIIATPHFSHKPIAVEAFPRGIHVLCEKPVGVHVKDVLDINHAYKNALRTNPSLIFEVMFQQRTYGYWRKIKDLIDQGELGKLQRVTWIVTDWYRPQSYYDSGSWRATWEGEGGGVLINQCPHNLDLFQWFFGMPSSVTAFASLGKNHDIEVEDEVTAYLEYDNGMVGHFITSTAEAPGTNRLEIVGEMGILIFEGKKITFKKNDISSIKYSKTSNNPFGKPKVSIEEVCFQHHGQSGHFLIIDNFIHSIRGMETALINGMEGLNSVMLGNGMLLSSLKGEKIKLPMDGEDFWKTLRELIENSTFRKKNVKKVEITSMSDSY